MISKLHYITQEITGKTHAQLAKEACEAGVNWVQLRVKNKSQAEWKEIAIETLHICKAYGAKLIINDNVALAYEIGADGAHVGKEDISISEARKITGNNFILGGTANTFEDIKTHVIARANYIGLGPYRFTNTKEKLSPVLGIEGYKNILLKCNSEKISTPVIAIGGILPADVKEIMHTGVYGIAVAGYINASKNKQEAVTDFIKNIFSTSDELERK